MVLSGDSIVDGDGSILTGPDGVASITVPYFGAGDFTVEAKITFIDFGDTAGAYILGQYADGAASLPENSWQFRLVLPQRVLLYAERRNDVTISTPTSISGERFAFELDKEYHCVVERTGGVATVYVNGKPYSSVASNTPLTNSPTPVLTSQVAPGDTTFGRCTRRIRDIRIAARPLYYGAIYDNFKDDTNDVPPIVPFIEGPTQQYTFKDNSLVDEVSGVPATLGSATNLSDNHVITSTNYSSRLNILPFYVKSGEDFVIELKVRISSIGSAGAMLLGSWVAGNQTGNSWNLYLRTNRTLGMNIALSLATTQTFLISTTKALNLNQDHHVVVTRASGVVKIYIDGEESANGEYNGPILRRTALTTTSWSDVNGWLSGQRWDIRLARGRSDFVIGALPFFERPQYRGNLRPSILAQYDFATSVVDSVSGASASIASASLTRGRLVLTNSGSSRFEITVPDFGAGDFTVEFSIFAGNITGADELPLLAQWHSSGATNDGNKFTIYSKTNGQIVVQIARSPTAGDFASGISAEGVLTLGEDHHVILQRHNGVVSLYVDGVSVVTFEFTGPLHAIGEYTLRSFYGPSPSYSYGVRELWNLRVASRALYTGDVPTYPIFPKT